SGLFFQCLNPRVARFDLLLLLANGIDQHDGETVVLDAFDLSFSVGGGKQRLDLRDLFRGKADVTCAVSLPVERDGAQAIEDAETEAKIVDVCLVAET